MSFLCVLFIIPFLAVETSSEKLLLIFLDGFRWDYIENYNLHNFKRIFELGVHADHMKTDFPTISIPNHYTIMTGLHTEHHGMTGNYMYDYRTGGKFLLSTTDERFKSHWWNDGEPLWITAVKQGKEISMFYWRGCEVEIRGHKPTRCTPFTDNVKTSQFDQAITESFELFQNGSTDISGVYSDIVDIAGHWYGPDSSQVGAALTEIDGAIGKMIDQWQEWGQKGMKVNVMVFSDHGMVRVTPQKLINVTDLLTDDLYVSIMESGPVMNVYTPQNDEEIEKEVFSRLHSYHPNMTCYHKKDLPDRWFYKEGKYVSPITCVADNGWFIVHPLQTNLWERETDKKLLEGEHGYDNNIADMWGIFLAMGPAFKEKITIPTLDAVDLYGVMCRLADLESASHDGNPQRLNSVLNQDWKVSNSCNELCPLAHLSFMLSVVISVSCFLHVIK